MHAFEQNLMSIFGSKNIQFISLISVALIALIGSISAQAKDYKVELVVFENAKPHSAYESTHYKAVKEATSEAVTWAIEPSMLLKEASAIKNSKEYIFIAHYSWGQEALPTSEAAFFNVLDTDVQGWVKVYASHLLFANLDLDFNGYRLTEKRRLKLNEKHFFDHPKFGILMQVSRLQPSSTTEAEADLKAGLE